MRLLSSATQAHIHTVTTCAANERTFLHWLNIAVTVGSVSAAMLGVSGHVHKHWGSDFTMTAMAARLVALAMMVVSIFIAAYATYLFSVRASLLKCGLKHLNCYTCKAASLTATIKQRPQHVLQAYAACPITLVHVVISSISGAVQLPNAALCCRFKQDSGYENKLLPMITAVCMTIVLASIFSGAVDTFWTSHLPSPPRPQPPAAPVPAEVPSAAAGPGFEYMYERSWELPADDVLDEEIA